MKPYPLLPRSAQPGKRVTSSAPRPARLVASPLGRAVAREWAGPAQLDPLVPVPSTSPQRPVLELRRGMRIGYVMDKFPRGSHSFVVQEIRELESRGVEVHVFSLDMPDERIDDTTSALGHLRSQVRYFLVDVCAYDSGRPLIPTGTVPDAGADLTAMATTSWKAHWIASHVAAAGLEHLHAHGTAEPASVAREAGRLTGLGYSFTVHAESLHDEADLRSLRERILEAKFVVTLNDFDRARLLRLCGPGVSDKLHGIPMGVNPDESRFSTAECHDSDSMLAIGPLVESSGFTDLIQAVCILRDRGRFARLTIIGEGPFEGTLRAQINGHGLADRVKLIGGVSRNDMAMLMRVHTVMVLPWVSEDRERDVLTNVVLEAMSAGLLVLSTDLPGIRELIDDGLSGRVISPNDPLWLAGALETLFDSPSLREQMVRRARAKVERRFAAAHNVSHLAQLFFEAVSRKRLAT